MTKTNAMTTEKRLEKAKKLLSGMATDRFDVDKGYTPETDVEKILVQLLMICSNQEKNISLLQQQIDQLTKYIEGDKIKPDYTKNPSIVHITRDTWMINGPYHIADYAKQHQILVEDVRVQQGYDVESEAKDKHIVILSKK